MQTSMLSMAEVTYAVRHSIVNFKPVPGKLKKCFGQLHYMQRPLAPVGLRRATSMTPSGGLFSIS